MVLELSGIVKAFGGVQALRGADLTARKGEILGLCGENGAGKSTLLKVLAGVHPRASYEGRVRIFGKDEAFTSARDAERAGIAIVHQELALVPELSVAANLALGHEPLARGALGSLGLLDDEAIELAARSLFARFGVDDAIDPRAPAGSLGIGRQQIVEIVRALSRDAKILVLDEPTAALTSAEAGRLMDWLRALRREGTTCLYVSHRLDEIFALCDRVTILRDGKTVDTLVVAETTPDVVVERMVGRAIPGRERSALRVAASDDATRLLDVRDVGVPNALTGISFHVRRGEVVAFAGAMGSGRTALLSTLFGAARGGYRGRIALDGRELSLRSPADAIAAGIAFVPEDRKGSGLVLGLSVGENLVLPRAERPAEARTKRSLLERLGFVDEEADELAIQARIRDLHIRGAASDESSMLSGGNQQKIVIGKWLDPPPRVLLLDEPTRGVDIGAREEIYGLLEALGDQGTSIVLASSDLAEVVRLAHRVFVLRRGAIVATLEGADITEEAIVGHATGAAKVTAA